MVQLKVVNGAVHMLIGAVYVGPPEWGIPSPVDGSYPLEPESIVSPQAKAFRFLRQSGFYEVGVDGQPDNEPPDGWLDVLSNIFAGAPYGEAELEADRWITAKRATANSVLEGVPFDEKLMAAINRTFTGADVVAAEKKARSRGTATATDGEANIVNIVLEDIRANRRPRYEAKLVKCMPETTALDLGRGQGMFSPIYRGNMSTAIACTDVFRVPTKQRQNDGSYFTHMALVVEKTWV